jgi:hypothetical protein
LTLTDVFQLQDEIVTRVVESLSQQLTATEHKTRRRDVPASPSAKEPTFTGHTSPELNAAASM